MDIIMIEPVRASRARFFPSIIRFLPLERSFLGKKRLTLSKIFLFFAQETATTIRKEQKTDEEKKDWKERAS